MRTFRGRVAPPAPSVVGAAPSALASSLDEPSPLSSSV